MGSRFSKSLFRDVPGTLPEHVRTCRFRRNPSSLDRTPKIRDYIRLNSWDSFLVTVPSISYETWVMYSSVIPGTSLFKDRLFLALSFVSLETSANFQLFLSVATILEKKKSATVEKTELLLYFFKGIVVSIENLTHFLKKETVSESTTVKMKSDKYYFNSTKVVINYNNIKSFISLIYTFSLAGKITVYTPSQGANSKMYFIHSYYIKRKNAKSGGK